MIDRENCSNGGKKIGIFLLFVNILRSELGLDWYGIIYLSVDLSILYLFIKDMRFCDSVGDISITL